MRRRRWMVLATNLIALSASACSDDDGTAPVTTPPDAGPPALIPGVPVVTLTTSIPSSTSTVGGKANATLAAFRKEDGSWTKLLPGAEVGTYVFQTTADRWAAAFVCANGDESRVVIHEQPIAVATFEVELGRECATTNANAFTLTGTLSNVAMGTGWLDFGYPLEARGAVLPIAETSTTTTYEEVNVAAGKWDIAFGVRNDSASQLSKVLFFRNHDLIADETLDIDLATAVVPGLKNLAIHGLDPREAITAPIHYTTSGGTRGLDVGPPSFESGTDVTGQYSTIPGALPGDRYRLEVLANGENDETGNLTSHGAVGAFHEAVDVDLTLVPVLTAPPIAEIAATPYLRIEAKTPARATAARYELTVLGKISNRSQHTWKIAIPASLVQGPEAAVAMPDLSAVEGWNPEWAVPTDVRREMTMTVYDANAPLGDGTVSYFTAHTTIIRPR